MLCLSAEGAKKGLIGIGSSLKLNSAKGLNTRSAGLRYRLHSLPDSVAVTFSMAPSCVQYVLTGLVKLGTANAPLMAPVSGL